MKLITILHAFFQFNFTFAVAIAIDDEEGKENGNYLKIIFLSFMKQKLNYNYFSFQRAWKLRVGQQQAQPLCLIQQV